MGPTDRFRVGRFSQTSDSFGLLPSPMARMFEPVAVRAVDLYLVPEDPADSTICEACQ